MSCEDRGLLPGGSGVRTARHRSLDGAQHAGLIMILETFSASATKESLARNE